LLNARKMEMFPVGRIMADDKRNDCSYMLDYIIVNNNNNNTRLSTSPCHLFWSGDITRISQKTGCNYRTALLRAVFRLHTTCSIRGACQCTASIMVLAINRLVPPKYRTHVCGVIRMLCTKHLLQQSAVGRRWRSACGIVGDRTKTGKPTLRARGTAGI
jgi:hypothetical protein